MQAIGTYNHHNIAALLNEHPYHIDSLLQMSDVCKMGQDPAMAAELVSRAVFCFECCFHTLFTPANGCCRMNYLIFENRAFFLALFRHTIFVSSRGCWRTAFEISKLLLSLDPTNDPLGALLMIDYYALRSNQYEYLVQLYEEWNASRQLEWLPNFAFSYALALFLLAKEKSSGLMVVYLGYDCMGYDWHCK
jgi:hypothetical protein